MTYIAFHTHIKTQYSTITKCFRCDLGREYTSNKFYEFLALDGTIHQISCTYTTEQNSVAERKHKHIVETARSPLLFASVPSVFWGEVVLIVVGLINTISSSHILGFSHFKKLYGYALNYFFFRVFCYTCFVLHAHEKHSKLSFQSVIYVFLGYGEGNKGYHYFDPITQKLYVSRHVVFLEHIPFFYILSTTHSLTRFDLIHINPVFKDSDNLSSRVSSTLNPHSYILTPITFTFYSTNSY